MRPTDIEIGDGSDADVLVCAKINGPLIFPDNLTGTCSRCQCEVQFRPHAPDVRKLCLECAKPEIEDENNNVTTTPRMLMEALEHLRRKRMS